MSRGSEMTLVPGRRLKWKVRLPSALLRMRFT